MKRFFITALAAFSIFHCQLSIAQDARKLTLDLETALEIALSENPTIKTADMEIERFDYVRRETLGNHLPSLSASGQYNFSIVKQEMAKGMSFGADMSAAANADLSIPLVVPAVYASLRLNRTQQALAVEQARASRIDLVNAVTKGFYQILLLERSYQVLLDSERTVSATVDNTREMFGAGLASEYDLVTAQVQLSNLQPTIYQAENGLESSRKMMRMLLGLPQDVEFTVGDNLDDMALSAARNSIREADLEGNSDLRAMDIQQNVLKRQLGVMRTQRMPTLAAFGNVTFTGQDQISNFGEVMAGLPKKTAFQWQHPVNVGAQLSVPIFAGRSNVMREKQLKNSIKQMELQRGYLEENVKVQADNAVAAIGTAYSKMRAGATTIGQARKGYDISRVRFEAGMGTILELNSAELSLTQARLNYTQAVYDYLSAQADYEKIIGQE